MGDDGVDGAAWAETNPAAALNAGEAPLTDVGEEPPADANEALASWAEAWRDDPAWTAPEEAVMQAPKFAWQNNDDPNRADANDGGPNDDAADGSVVDGDEEPFAVFAVGGDHDGNRFDFDAAADPDGAGDRLADATAAIVGPPTAAAAITDDAAMASESTVPDAEPLPPVTVEEFRAGRANERFSTVKHQWSRGLPAGAAPGQTLMWADVEEVTEAPPVDENRSRRNSILVALSATAALILVVVVGLGATSGSSRQTPAGVDTEGSTTTSSTIAVVTTSGPAVPDPGAPVPCAPPAAEVAPAADAPPIDPAAPTIVPANAAPGVPVGRPASRTPKPTVPTGPPTTKNNPKPTTAPTPTVAPTPRPTTALVPVPVPVPVPTPTAPPVTAAPVPIEVPPLSNDVPPPVEVPPSAACA